MPTRLALVLFALASARAARRPRRPPTRRCSSAPARCTSTSPLIDGHNDFPWALREKAERDLDKLDITKPQPSLMTDIPRLRAGGVGGQFWSVYVAGRAAGAGRGHRHARTDRHRPSDDAEVPGHVRARARPRTMSSGSSRAGKIASLIGMEGGHSIDNSLGRAADVLSPGRAVHDAHALQEHRRGPIPAATSRRPTGCRRSASRSCAR